MTAATESLAVTVVLLSDDADCWHLPLPTREGLAGEVTLESALQHFTTRPWPTVCGERGDLYALGGFVLRRMGCQRCRRLAAAERAA